MSDRQVMITELKRVVQPRLRADKFAGTFPHFRRLGQDAIDLITFQFDRNGGGFVIEIARCPSDGIVTAWGKHIPLDKVQAWDAHPNFRKRVKPRTGSGTDAWFRFDATNASKVAAEVLLHLCQDGLWSDVKLACPDRTAEPKF